MAERQDQRAGDNSANLQAGRDIVITQGPTVTEVIAITEQTFHANLPQMRGIAQDVFNERMERILSDTVERLGQEKPETIQRAADPDFQIALLDAAKAYGRTGDQDLEKLLVDILVDRVDKPNRSLAHIILGEALTVAPKLTQAHIDALTVSWVAMKVSFPSVTTVEDAITQLTFHLLPFLSAWPISEPSYQHLQYLGCGQVSVMQWGFNQLLSEKFPALYDVHKASPQTATADIRDALQNAGNAHLQAFAQNWDQSVAKNFQPTSLGIVIGHANHRRKTNIAVDLSIWVH